MDPLLRAMEDDGIVQPGCPNVLPGAKCVDPDCTYCKIANAEEPKERNPK